LQKDKTGKEKNIPTTEAKDPLPGQSSQEQSAQDFTTTKPNQESEEAPRKLDQGWKMALARLLPSALELVWKSMYDSIDWSQGFLDLEQEFEGALTQAKLNNKEDRRNQLVDKLFRISLKSGKEVWILLHVEIQGQEEANFPERMFSYFVAIKNRHRGLHVEQVAIFLDTNLNYIPDTYTFPSFSHAKLTYQYKVIKIAQWKGIITTENVGDAPHNVFKPIILGQLMTMFPNPGESRIDICRKLAVIIGRNFPGPDFYEAMEFIKLIMPLKGKQVDQLEEEMKLMAENNEIPAVVFDYYETARFKKIFAEGEAKGKAEGRAEGRAEGKAEGRAEAELKIKLSLLEKLLASKFPQHQALEMIGMSEQEVAAAKQSLKQTEQKA
jgi:predicted transposase YdaD